MSGRDANQLKEAPMGKYAELRAHLEHLNDPEARFELGEDARRAQLAGLADTFMLELLNDHDRLEMILLPRSVPSESQS